MAERGADSATPRTMTSSEAAVSTTTLSAAAGRALAREAVPEERYVVGDEIGRGGLGRVVLARDERLGRTVALKELHSPSPALRARFLREIRLTAQLEHPAIVPVYDAGRWGDDELFYAMRLVQGRNLKEAIAQAPDLRARLALLPHAIAAADAIAYAHRHGVVHRDIKPSNVLVGDLGETLVVDWGVAKALGDVDVDAGTSTPDDAATTQVGAVVGTPAYMAPEQARGARDDGSPLGVDDLKAADVYALGALLYHLLSGAPPYASTASVDGATATLPVLEAVRRGPPVPLVDRAPGAPEELLAIVDNAMARSARDRYRSAEELAADLRRFSTGQLVGAHRYTWRERAARFARNNRAALSVAGIAAVIVVVIAAISVQRIVHARDVAEARTRELTLVQASTALDRDPTAAVAWLKTLRLAELSDDDELRLRAVAADAAARGVAKQVLALHIKVENLMLAPRGHIVVIVTDRALLLWDVDRAEVVARYPADDPLEVRFTADGRKMITRGRQGTLRVFPGVDERGRPLSLASAPIATMVGDRGWTNDMALSRDGTHALLASPDGAVRLFSLDDPSRPALVLARHGGAVEAVDVSADGTRVASSGDDGVVRVLERRGDGDGDGDDAWRELVHLTLPRAAGWVRFVEDDRAIVFTDAAGDVRRLSLADERAAPVSLGGRSKRIDDLIVRPDRRALAVGYHDGLIVFFDLATSPVRRVELVGHTDEIVQMSWSPDGARIASGGLDRAVRIFDVRGDHAGRFGGRALLGHSGVLEATSFSADGTLLASGGQDGTVRVWDVRDDGSRAFIGHTEDIYAVAASPDGTHLASAAKDKTVRVWRRDDGTSQLVGTLPHIAYSIAYSPDGRWLAVSGYGPTVDVWPIASDGAAQLDGHRVLDGHTGSVWRVAFSSDSRFLATASADGSSRAWDTSTWQGHELHHHDSEGALFVAISPDGRRAATAGMDKTARVSFLDGEPRTVVLKGHEERLLRLAFSPDSRTIATGSWDRSVRLWDVDSGAARATITAHEGRIRSLAFAPDGTELVTGSDDNSVRITELATMRTRLLGRHRNYVRELALSPDGAWIASLGWDESVRLWHRASGKLVGLERRDDVLMSTLFTPDGTELVLAGYPKLVDIRPLASAAGLPIARDALGAWLSARTEVAIDAQTSEPSSARLRTTPDAP